MSDTHALQVIEITDPDERAALCNRILRALPAWFGIESSIVEYVKETRNLPVFAAMLQGEALGFAALKKHTPYAMEIAVMGVLEPFHGRGAGRGLVNGCKAYARAAGCNFLTVKTLADFHPDEGYANTRKFYRAMGFYPLEVFPLLWDANNPCLMMCMSLAEEARS